MARTFKIPDFYKSPIISNVKKARAAQDVKKRDFSPSVLDFQKIRFKIARHFGFCFGVENAIEIAYKALSENDGKKIYLLSEMIHNPHVNKDLRSRGVEFILEPNGNQLIDFDSLEADDIVIVPAFGTSIELFEKLKRIGIDPYVYNTTCPFVEKVWKRAAQLGDQRYTVIIHGKEEHEETKATFSHAKVNAASLVIRDLNEAHTLAEFIVGERNLDDFAGVFAGRYSNNFDIYSSLNRVGVVNQTTMLATETQEISEVIKAAVIKKYGTESLADHFADNRDTLCYATSENQTSVKALIEDGGDIALVVGGYNSSNTSHLYELCQNKVRTFYIKDSDEILSLNTIKHLNFPSSQLISTTGWLPLNKDRIDILITAGASCPDVIVDQVITKIVNMFDLMNLLPKALAPFTSSYEV